MGLTFRCDRCGVQYASSQTLREGRVYQAECPSCGHLIRLRSPAGEGQSPGSPKAKPRAPEGGPSGAASGKPAPLHAPPPAAAAPAAEATEPVAAPATRSPAPLFAGTATPDARPDGGYYDLFLDDAESQSPPAKEEAAVARRPQEPPGPVALAKGPAEGRRRNLGKGLLAGGIALGVLFAAVGALALRRPAKEDAPVSRALLPRAEWVTTGTKPAGPSQEFLEELEAEERQAADEEEPAPVRRRSRSPAGSAGKRQARAVEVAAARALTVPVPPVPSPEIPAAPPSVMQPVAPPPQPELTPPPPPPRAEKETPAEAPSATALAGAIPQPDARVDFTEGMTSPVFVSGPQPQYTSRAIDRGVQGLMVVRCVVTTQGTVHGCEVIKGLPFMDQAVIDALERRRYRPATLRGRPVEVNYTFRIKLALPR